MRAVIQPIYGYIGLVTLAYLVAILFWSDIRAFQDNSSTLSPPDEILLAGLEREIEIVRSRDCFPLTARIESAVGSEFEAPAPKTEKMWQYRTGNSFMMVCTSRRRRRSHMAATAPAPGPSLPQEGTLHLC